MAEEGFKRKLTAILSADVIGYSRLMRDDEEATVRDIAAHRALISDIVQQHYGRVVDSPGDNILAEFASVVDAVNGAIKIQQEISKSNADTPEDRRMEFRIGINLGDVIDEEERIYGDGVNIAARVEGLAAGGGIAISGIVYDSIKDKFSLGYHYLGEQDVKNIPEPIRVYRLLTEPYDAGKMIGEEKPKSLKSRLLAFVAVGLIVLAAGILIVWNNYFQAKIEPASVEKMAYPLPEKPSIAVLPFDNMSGDQAREYIADGLSENIISSLSKIPDMLVIARNSTFVYKGKAVKVNRVAEELGVKYVLEGSVQKSGDNIRVTTQLIDAIEGHHLWSEKYDRSIKDFFTVQDDIARNIMVALQVELTEGEQARIWHATENLEALGYATKGIALMQLYTRQNNARARELFKKAAELDPNYAFAWISIAWTHGIDSRYGFSESRGESFKRCIEFTQKAAALNDSMPEVHSSWNFIYMLQRQFDKAIAEGKKAVALGPSDATSHMLLSLTLHFAGRFEESIAHIKEAMRLDPYYPPTHLFILGSSYCMAKEYEKAIAAFEKAMERVKVEGGQRANNYTRFIQALVEFGQIERAEDEAAKLLKLDPNFSLKIWQKSLFYKNPSDLERTLNALRKSGLSDEPPLPLPDQPSIAVLAFDNLSGDPEQEYFADGLSEEIITALSSVPKLFVIARNSSFIYKGKPVNVQQICRELGVRYILEGSVRKSGDRLRITAQLINALKGNHLWAESYDRKMDDLFALQDEITLKIITEMQVELTEGEKTRSHVPCSSNLKAYLKYLKARERYIRANIQDNAIAQRLAEEAIAIDPGYACAYSLLGATHLQKIGMGSAKSPQQTMKTAYMAINKAIALNPSLAGPHAMLSSFYRHLGQFDKAQEKAEKALSLNPNSLLGNLAMGNLLRWDGRAEEAISFLKHATRIDPFNSGCLGALGITYFFVKRHEEGIGACQKAARLNRDSIYPQLCLAAIYGAIGRDEEARVAASAVLKLNPQFSLEHFSKNLKYKKTEDLELLAASLREAGL